jgi:hypothetical protein
VVVVAPAGITSASTTTGIAGKDALEVRRVQLGLGDELHREQPAVQFGILGSEQLHVADPAQDHLGAASRASRRDLDLHKGDFEVGQFLGRDRDALPIARGVEDKAAPVREHANADEGD